MLELRHQIRGGDEEERARGEREAEGKDRRARREEEEPDPDPDRRVDRRGEHISERGPTGMRGREADRGGREAVRDLVERDDRRDDDPGALAREERERDHEAVEQAVDCKGAHRERAERLNLPPVIVVDMAGVRLRGERAPLEDEKAEEAHDGPEGDELRREAHVRPEFEALRQEVHKGEAQEDSRGKAEHDVRHALGHARPNERDHRDDEGGRPGDPGECQKKPWVDHVPESHGNGLFKSSALLNNIQIRSGLSLLTMPIVSMSVDLQTLRKLEEVVKRRGYPSRSEAFREALRDFIDEAEWTAESGASTLILAAVVDKESMKADLVSIQHRFEEIRTMLHSHLDESSCLEIFVAQGSSGRLKEFVQRLRRAKGVKAIKFISTSRQG